MEEKDLHASLKTDLTHFWEHFRRTPFNRLKPQEILSQIAHLETVSRQIGGTIAADIAKLSSDVHRYLQGQLSLSDAWQMVEDALRVEHDTKEL